MLGELTYIVLAVLFTIVNLGRRHFIDVTSATYTAEEVPYEDDDLSILCVVELIESDGFATFVKNLQLAGLSERLLIRFGMTLALLCGHICNYDNYRKTCAS